MTYDKPEFVQIQYWNRDTQQWEARNTGTNLMNPAKYVIGLESDTTPVRAVNPLTGSVVYGCDLL